MAGMKTINRRAHGPGDWLARALVLVGAAAFSLSLDGCAAGSSYAEARTASAPPPSQPSGGAMAEQTAVATTQAMPASATESADNEGASVGGSDDAQDAPSPAPQAAAPARPSPQVAPARVERAAVAMTSGTTGNARPVNNRGPATNTGGSTPQIATPGGTPAQTQQPQPPAPMLIYVADVQLQTARNDIPQTIERVIEAATSIGGYLVRRTDDSVQVRVPSMRFRESLARVETFGEVLHRSVSADDVSEEYRDIEVRLQNLRAVRRRLEEFLQRAATMQDALNVEHELERVTREIDTLEGRLRFLGARVAFSLVTVHVQARPEHVDMAAPEPSPTRRLLNLPVEWLGRLGLERLMDVSTHD